MTTENNPPVTSSASAPAVEPLDTPRALAMVRLFFVKPTKADLHKVRKILGPVILGTEKFVNTTIVMVRTPQQQYAPREVMAGMVSTFGHIKSYDGCDMAFLEPVSAETTEVAHG